MSNFLKRFKGSKKSPEKDETPKEIEDPIIPRDKEEFIKSELSLSPSTSDSDGSPHHIISQTSLFSGMKLTKSSRVLEPVLSPYSTPVPTNICHDDETSKFDLLNEDDKEGSGFLFLNQTTPTPTLNEPDSSSGFSFITQPAPDIPPLEEVTSLSPDPTDTTDQTTGFTFLLKEPHSDDNNPESSTTDPHSSTTDPHSSNTDPHSSTTDPHSSTTDPHSSTTDPHSSTTNPHSGTTNPQTDSHTFIPITDSEHSHSSVTPHPLPQLSSIPPVTHKVGRQAPPNKKKKKHKAVRPGQERNDEIYSGLVMEDAFVISDLDGISISTIDSDTRTDDSIDVVIAKGKETIIPLENSKGEIKTSDEMITDDSISEATTENTGDMTETTGDTLENTGDMTETIIDTTEIAGKVTGNTVDVTGGTVEAIGGIMEVTGDTVDVTGNTVVAIDDGSDGTLVQLDEELTSSITIIKPSNNDLVGIFSPLTSQDDPANENDDTVNYSIELSPVEKMATLFEVAESNDKVIRNNIDKATQQFSTAIEKNGDVIKKLTKRRQHIKELKAQEAVALSDENYEHAELLRQELESINVFKDMELLVDTQTKVDRWLKECNSLMTSQIALHIEMKEKLTNLKVSDM